MHTAHEKCSHRLIREDETKQMQKVAKRIFCIYVYMIGFLMEIEWNEDQSSSKTEGEREREKQAWSQAMFYSKTQRQRLDNEEPTPTYQCCIKNWMLLKYETERKKQRRFFFCESDSNLILKILCVVSYMVVLVCIASPVELYLACAFALYLFVKPFFVITIFPTKNKNIPFAWCYIYFVILIWSLCRCCCCSNVMIWNSIACLLFYSLAKSVIHFIYIKIFNRKCIENWWTRY